MTLYDEQRRVSSDETWRGAWTRTYDGKRFRYYWHGLRVPSLLWSMFS